MIYIYHPKRHRIGATEKAHPYTGTNTNTNPFARRRIIRSYFDDVSRYYQTNAWHPVYDAAAAPNLTPPSEHISAEKDGTKKQKQKQSEYAQSLSNAEIRTQIEHWTSESNLIGSSEAHEREHVSKVRICRCTTLPACMAELWNEIQTTVRENTYLYDGSWKVSSIDENTGKVRRGSLILVALPFCDDLYDYAMFQKFHAAMDFTRGQTRYFGHTFGLTHYHPSFVVTKNNSTYYANTAASSAATSNGTNDILSTAVPAAATTTTDEHNNNNLPHYYDSDHHNNKRSPYPVFALTIGGAFDNEEELAVLRAIGIQQPEVRLSEQADWLRNARADLTIIYNRAAADGTTSLSASDAASSVVLNNKTKRRRIAPSRARRNYSAKFTRPEIRQMCERWIEDNEDVSNALEYAQSIDGWFICAETRAENVYADIWGVIGEVFARGKLLQKKHPQPNLHGSSWLEHFGKFIGKQSNVSNEDCATSTSTVFISTKFCAFNSEAFKKFAITINAALKRLTDDKMFLEIFHPEYVGKKGYNSSFRRAPYAMLMLCYDSTKEDGSDSGAGVGTGNAAGE